MVRGSVQRLAGKSGERLLQWRRSCVPWRHGSTPGTGMCCVLCGGSGAALTTGGPRLLRQSGSCFAPRDGGLRLGLPHRARRRAGRAEADTRSGGAHRPAARGGRPCAALASRAGAVFSSAAAFGFSGTTVMVVPGRAGRGPCRLGFESHERTYLSK